MADRGLLLTARRRLSGTGSMSLDLALAVIHRLEDTPLEELDMDVFIISNSSTGARLCRDGRFRRVAKLGRFPEGVRVWHSWARAMEVFYRVRPKVGVPLTIHTVASGYRMTQRGKVVKL